MSAEKLWLYVCDFPFMRINREMEAIKMETRRKATLVKGSNAFFIENNRIVRKVTIVSCAGGLYKIRFEDGAGSCVKGYRLYDSKEDADAVLDKERRQYRRFSSPYT